MRSDQIELPKFVSLGDIHGFLRELDQLQEALYRTGDDGFAAVLASGVGGEISRVVAATLQKRGVADGDVSAVSETIEAIKLGLRDVPVVKLQIAVELPIKSLQRIHDWLEINVTNPVAMDVEIDPELLGGVKVTYSGKYCDKSIAGKWAEIWQKVTEQMWDQGGI